MIENSPRHGFEKYWRSQLAWGFVVILVIAIFSGVIWYLSDPGSVESDEVMIQRFYTMRNTFDELASIISKHSEPGKSGKIWGGDHLLLFTGPDLTTCQNYLAKIGSKDGANVWYGSKDITIEIPMWIKLPPAKGYFYTTKEVVNLSPSLNNFVKNTPTGTKWVDTPVQFRHITGNWYLIYSVGP